MPGPLRARLEYRQSWFQGRGGLANGLGAGRAISRHLEIEIDNGLE
jgi:hypothetical protein